MDVKTLTYLFVGLSFALYIGIAIWSRAASTREFYVPAAMFIRSPTAWRRPPTG